MRPNPIFILILLASISVGYRPVEVYQWIGRLTMCTKILIIVDDTAYDVATMDFQNIYRS